MVMDKTRIAERIPLISWGAVFAGLFFIVAASWLLFLLGSAIGVSIADISDLKAMGDGLGWGAVIWLILTSIVVYFIGGWLTARLAGTPDNTDGLLHGLVLWSAGTVLTLLLGSWGVSNTVQAGQSLIRGTASMVGNIVQGVGTAGSTVAGAVDSQLMTDIQAMIKRQISQAVAEAGDTVSTREAQRAITQLDANTLQAIAGQIVQGDMQSARSQLANATNLSQQEVDQIIKNISQQMQQSPSVQQVTQFLDQQVNQAIKQISQTSPQVNQNELRRAVQNLDGDTLTEIARQLVMGNTESAKNVLAVNTNLSEQEINSVIDGISQATEQRLEQAKEKVADTVETVSNYTQAVVWTLFFSSVLALIATLIGGSMGARRL